MPGPTERQLQKHFQGQDEGDPLYSFPSHAYRLTLVLESGLSHSLPCGLSLPCWMTSFLVVLISHCWCLWEEHPQGSRLARSTGQPGKSLSSPSPPELLWRSMAFSLHQMSSVLPPAVEAIDNNLITWEGSRQRDFPVHCLFLCVFSKNTWLCFQYSNSHISLFQSSYLIKNK